MKYEEYEAITKTLTADNGPVVVKQLLDGIKEDVTALDALRTESAEKDAKIRELQDVNIKLFLSQTGNADDGASNEEASVEQLEKNVNDAIEQLLLRT